MSAPTPHAVLSSAPLIVSLKGDRAFGRLRKGRAGNAKLLGLRWRPTQEGRVRVGIVVSKKVGKAVVRNRVRRRLREALGRILRGARLQPNARWRGSASFDLLVMARPDAAGATYKELSDALAYALRKGGVLC